MFRLTLRLPCKLTVFYTTNSIVDNFLHILLFLHISLHTPFFCFYTFHSIPHLLFLHISLHTPFCCFCTFHSMPHFVVFTHFTPNHISIPLFFPSLTGQHKLSLCKIYSIPNHFFCINGLGTSLVVLGCIIPVLLLVLPDVNKDRLSVKQFLGSFRPFYAVIIYGRNMSIAILG